MRYLLMIAVCLLLFISVNAQDYNSALTGAQIDSLLAGSAHPGSSILYVSANTVANGVNKFNTIAAAIAGWSLGKTILLAGELFNEDVSIVDSGLVLFGVSQESSKINSLTVSGENTVIGNLTVEKRFKFICTDVYSEYHEGNIFKKINFKGGVHIGTATDSAKNRSTFYDCELLGIDSTVYCKNGQGGRFHGGFVNRYNVTIEGGYLSFANPREVFFKKIYLDNSKGYSLMTIRNCESVNFGDSIYSANTTNAYAVFSMNNCKAYSRGTWGNPMNDLWVWGKFEFDVFSSLWNMPSTVRWYATVPSRIVNLTQTMWNASTTISGSAAGLLNLHIFNSIFSAAQVSGLGSDVNNAWSAFIDN